MNSSDRKSIEVKYYKTVDGGWVFDSKRSGMSDGISHMFQIPPFRPEVVHPKQQHLNAIMEAMRQAGFCPGERDDTIDSTTHEVTLVLKKIKEKGEKTKPKLFVPDDDHSVHELMLRESWERLSTSQGTEEWVKRCRARISDPKQLSATDPKIAQPNALNKFLRKLKAHRWVPNRAK